MAGGRKNLAPILSTIVFLSNLLHIVCLDAPSPPDYGGGIDMHYKIKALAQTGKKLILHYFNYNPLRNAKGLEENCVAVYAYKRKSFLEALPLSQPFIVQSRINRDLIARLNGDSHPILLEGLHCSGIVPFVNNPKRIVLRMHNDEAAYYLHLAQTEINFFKRRYFLRESKLLKTYQQTLRKDIRLACLSELDIERFKTSYGFQKVSFVPCFIPWQTLSINEGKGDYCLYHGNMSVSENEEAALWLIKEIFNKLDLQLIIAGKGISKRLQHAAGAQRNVQLLTNPSIDEIEGLVRTAQINVLPSMNNTGVKLKLLNALLNGRHCITNYNGVNGSRIKSGVTVAEKAEEWIQQIEDQMQRNMSEQEITERKLVLNLYNNRQNAESLNALW